MVLISTRNCILLKNWFFKDCTDSTSLNLTYLALTQCLKIALKSVIGKKMGRKFEMFTLKLHKGIFNKNKEYVLWCLIFVNQMKIKSLPLLNPWFFQPHLLEHKDLWNKLIRDCQGCLFRQYCYLFHQKCLELLWQY